MLYKNNRTVIGITTYGRDESGNFYLPDKYVDAVRRAEGLPVLLPPGESDFDQILEIIDGLIFAGGGDIGPNLYGGSQHPSISRVDSERDKFEIALAQKVLNTTKPVLGICRGFQLLTVATGGNLISHVPDEFGNKIEHRTGNSDSVEHLVQINPKSRLSKITGASEISVKSKHHQAAHTIPDGWQIVAQAADGVIEGMEYRPHPWMIAVLWHPELSLEDQHHQRLFRALVEAAGRS